MHAPVRPLLSYISDFHTPQHPRARPLAVRRGVGKPFGRFPHALFSFGGSTPFPFLKEKRKWGRNDFFLAEKEKNGFKKLPQSPLATAPICQPNRNPMKWFRFGKEEGGCGYGVFAAPAETECSRLLLTQRGPCRADRVVRPYKGCCASRKSGPMPSSARPRRSGCLPLRGRCRAERGG